MLQDQFPKGYVTCRALRAPQEYMKADQLHGPHGAAFVPIVRSPPVLCQNNGLRVPEIKSVQLSLCCRLSNRQSSASAISTFIMTLIPSKNHEGIAVVSVGAVFASLAILAFGLRIWAHRIQKAGLNWSDYSCGTGLVNGTPKPSGWQYTSLFR